MRIEHHTGAGGILGQNLVWHAEPDGLTIGLSSGTTLMLASLARGEGVQFDATEFTYLGRPTADDRIIFVGARIADPDDAGRHRPRSSVQGAEPGRRRRFLRHGA